MGRLPLPHLKTYPKVSRQMICKREKCMKRVSQLTMMLYTVLQDSFAGAEYVRLYSKVIRLCVTYECRCFWKAFCKSQKESPVEWVCQTLPKHSHVNLFQMGRQAHLANVHPPSHPAITSSSVWVVICLSIIFCTIYTSTVNTFYPC